MGKPTELESVVAERTDRIRQVVEGCIDRRAAGEVVTDETLIAAHPDLMPEIESALRDLRLVQNAHLEAEHLSRVGLHIRCPHCQNPIEVVDEPSLSDLACPSCGSQFHVTDDSERTFRAARGEMVNHFQLLERVGAGAFGSVWSARDTQLDRTVALKIPRKGQMGPKDQEQFIREARSAAQLKHPGIVRVLEVGLYKDRIYIACDFIEGMDLAEWLEYQQPTPREAAELCSSVAEALQHAHKHGVIHRDLKPSNVMLDKSSEPHLTDFGLAKREAAEVTMTLDGKLLGTPAYMSPEQARGEAHAADARSDVYSLGVILFEMLTGERPFRGSTRMLLHQVLVEDAPSPRKLCHVVPRDLETICLKCLEKDPCRRYPSAGEMRDDLNRFLSDKPVRARPITRAGRTWRWGKRHPLVAVTLAMMVVLFAGIMVAWQRSEALSDRLRASVYEAEMLSAYEAWDAGDLAGVERLLRSQVPQRGQKDLRGFEWYYLADLNKDAESDSLTFDKMVVHTAIDKENRIVFALLRNKERLRNDEIVQVDLTQRRSKTIFRSSEVQGFEPQCVAVSADGARLAIGGQVNGDPVNDGPGKIQVVRLNDERQYKVSSDDLVRNVAFSPDGMRAASVDASGLVQVWNAETGEIQWKSEFTEDVPPQTNLKFSPDSQSLVALRRGNGRFLAWDASTGHQRAPLQALGFWLLGLDFSPDGSKLAIVGERLHILNGSTFEPHPPVYGRHLGRATSVAYSPDGKQLAIGTMGKATMILDTESNELLQEIPEKRPFRQSNHFLTYSADGSELISIAHDAIRIVRIDKEAKSQQVGINWGTTFAVDNTFNRIAFPGPAPANAIVVWDPDKAEPFRLTGHESRVMSVAFSHDNRLLASGTETGSIRIWNMETRKQTLEIATESRSRVLTMACSPVQDLLVAKSGGSMSAWEMKTGRALWSVKDHKAENIVFSSDGRMFTAGGEGDWSDPGLLTVWNVDGEPKRLEEIPHERFVTRLAYWQSPDGTDMVLAAADRAAQIVLYDVKGPPLRKQVLRGHTNLVFNLEFDPSGRRLISSGHDDTVRMWSIASGRQVGVLNRRLLSLSRFLPSTSHERFLITEFNSSDLAIRDIDVLNLDAQWERRDK